MCAKTLKKPPLVEAIVEMRWVPRDAQSSQGFDLNYNLLVGRLSEVFTEYPEYEALSNVEVPARIAGENHLVQHRFRASPGGWPLIQVGPTAFTINETENYDWDNTFRQRAIDGIKKFFDAYPRPDKIQVRGLLLRYIDAIDFDWSKGSLLEFLSKELKTEISLPETLFADTAVGERTASLDLRVSFECPSPRGRVHLRFASGQSGGKNALIMETMVESNGDDVPELPGGFARWLDSSHEVISTWFKRLTEGELYRTFQHD